MNRLATICSPIVLLLATVQLGSCTGSARLPEPERAPAERSTSGAVPRMVPLDTANVPASFPASFVLGDPTMMKPKVEADAMEEKKIQKATELTGEVYRVQVFAGNELSAAKMEKRVAAELFDCPTYLDYDPPYFRIRVGEFADRRDAEPLLERARAAGYGEAIIIRALAGIRQVTPAYQEESNHPDPGGP